MSESSVRRDPILRWSIGTKLIIAFLALAIIPMSATAYYNLTRGQREVAQVTRESLVELSRSTAHRIGQLLTENQRTSATLAGQPSVNLFLAASGDEREALTPRAYQTLQNFADTHPDYDAPGLLDVNGIVVASLEERLVGKDRSFRDYFQASIQGESYVSDMLVGRATGRPGVFLTNPVVTTEGEIVGINIVWLKGDTIWAIIDDVVVGEEGIAYLVDQDGVIIAHPNRDLLYHSLGELAPEAVTTISATIRFGTVGGTETPLIPESLGLDDLAAVLVAPPQSPSASFPRLRSGQAGQAPPIPGGKSGTYRYYSPLDHRDHVVGYTRLESHPWTVVVDLPEAQFLAPLRRLGAMVWGSAGLVGVLTLIVSILLIRSITRPIRRLTDAAIAVEHEQPFEPADIEDVTSGHDEIAHLGRVFSRMVLALRQREEQLDHLNAVLRAIRNVNQLITRERDRDRLLQGACDNLIETRGYFNAWIALQDRSGGPILGEAAGLVTTAEAGLGEAFLPLVERLERGELTACGRRALERPGVVTTQDPPSACADCPLAEQYAGRGAMTVRLEYGGKVYGLSSVSIPAHLAADEEEHVLFQEVAGDIAFALYSIELEEERVRAEEELKRTLAELADSQAAALNMMEDAEEARRAAERANEDLRKEIAERVRVEAELERSNRELERFAYVASHDLQEPLRKVQAFGDRLKTKYAPALDERGRDYLERMQDAARRMQAMINDLLTFSRVATRANPFVPVDLRQVVQEAVSDLEIRIEQTGGRVEIGPAAGSGQADLPTIEADPTQMRQLLENLIGNGLKFHREGVVPVVKVASKVIKQREGELCQILVEDNGIGFDEKYLDRIFQPFQRLHGRDKYAGTGIGLAICRKIAERHGGSIAAKSAPGRGATFIVTLPVSHSSQQLIEKK